jgi:hypothetical protein
MIYSYGFWNGGWEASPRLSNPSAEPYRLNVFVGKFERKVKTRKEIDIKIYTGIQKDKRAAVTRLYSDQLWAGQLKRHSSSPGRVKEFSLQYRQTGSSAHLASYPTGNERFSGDKLTETWN